MLREIGGELYLYLEKDKDIKNITTKILEDYFYLDLEKQEVEKAFKGVKSECLYLINFISIPYEIDYWGDVFEDCKHEIELINMSELVEFIKTNAETMGGVEYEHYIYNTKRN